MAGWGDGWMAGWGESGEWRVGFVMMVFFEL